jgi:hypothetical protein
MAPDIQITKKKKFIFMATVTDFIGFTRGAVKEYARFTKLVNSLPFLRPGSNLILPRGLESRIDFSKSSPPSAGRYSKKSKKQKVLLHYTGVFLHPAIVIMHEYLSAFAPEKFRPFFMANVLTEGITGGDTVIAFIVDTKPRGAFPKYGIAFQGKVYYPRVVTGDSEVTEYLREIAFPSKTQRSHNIVNPYIFNCGVKAVSDALDPNIFDPARPWEEKIRIGVLQGYGTHDLSYQVDIFLIDNDVDEAVSILLWFLYFAKII